MNHLNNLFNSTLGLKISRILTRSLRGGVKDIGIKKRAKILGDISKLEECDFDDLEADFHAVGKSQKQHEREMEAFYEREKYHIVKQKYFKEKTPNYLTWADKQQIKYLHSSNPEEWTVERLSDGFPALPETITTIVKNDWIPKNHNRVKSHDNTVQLNWLEFKKGNFKDLPFELKTHLSKFTTRELNFNPDLSVFTAQSTKNVLEKKGGEFSQIIESYKTLKPKHQESPQVQEAIIANSEELNFSSENIRKPKKKKRELLTYDELQIENNGTVQDLDLSQSSKEIILEPNEINLKMAKFQTTESQVNLYKPQKDYSNLLYPERITIPKNKFKRGHTYKLNDCFYDSDGEFLYRVPGCN